MFRLERLALSSQCGFASTEEGNLLTTAEQDANLKLVAETAKKCGAELTCHCEERSLRRSNLPHSWGLLRANALAMTAYRKGRSFNAIGHLRFEWRMAGGDSHQ